MRQSIPRVLLSKVPGPALDRFTFRGQKTITAIVRVKNEEQYLEPCVRSVAPFVDEVLIVDNLSTDRTPEIIMSLIADHPKKVRGVIYHHRLARYGEENLQLASSIAGRRSPRLIANFYNWSLRHAKHPFILKWDGDTIATPRMACALAQFRSSDALSLWHVGANLHPDGEHLLANQPFETEEPRLFYRKFAHYNNGLGYCELLKSPFVGREAYIAREPEPLYVHMKWCKSRAFENMSVDLQQRALAHVEPGEPVSREVRETIARWSLV